MAPSFAVLAQSGNDPTPIPRHDRHLGLPGRTAFKTARGGGFGGSVWGGSQSGLAVPLVVSCLGIDSCSLNPQSDANSTSNGPLFEVLP